MTRVPRYENLSLPSPEAFGREIGFVKETLTGLHAEESITGAFLYGSATNPGDTNPGSDIDLLVTSRAQDPCLADSLRAMTTEVHHRSRVPIDVTYFTEEQLSSGAHGYYRSNLVAWLQQQSVQNPENVIGKNPTEYIKPLEADLLESIDDELGKTAHYFEMTYMKGVCEDPESLLETILNFPHKAGRECISSLYMEGLIPAEIITSASKKNISHMVEQVFGEMDPRLMELYGEIVADFKRYTELADTISTFDISKDEYDMIVAATVADDLPKAVELAKRLQAAFRTLAPGRAWPPMRAAA